MDVVEKINIRNKDYSDETLDERIERKVNPLSTEYNELKETTTTTDVEKVDSKSILVKNVDKKTTTKEVSGGERLDDSGLSFTSMGWDSMSLNPYLSQPSQGSEVDYDDTTSKETSGSKKKKDLDEYIIYHPSQGSEVDYGDSDSKSKEVSGSKKKKSKSRLHKVLTDDISYHTYPDSGYDGDDDYSVRNRRVDKKNTKWVKVKDTGILDLFFMDVIDDTPIETDDENLPDDLPKDKNSDKGKKKVDSKKITEVKLSNKSTPQEKRYGKKYYNKNKIKLLRKKRMERRKTLNKKVKEYRKNRDTRLKTPTGKKKLKYKGSKKHLGDKK